jgi:ankyrin repeat protein
MSRRTLFIGLLAVAFAATAHAGPTEDLYAGCMQCDLAKVEAAVAGGADVNALHPSGQNTLALAFFCPDVTKYLIEKGVSPNAGNYPALVSAANNYSVEVVEQLLKAGADPNKGSATGVYPLHVAVQQTNCVPCLKALLDAGADAKLKNAQGATPIQVLMNFGMSREGRRENFAKGAPIMEKYGLKVPAYYRNLPDDINGAERDMLDLLLAKGADVGAPTPDGYTPLVMALKGGKADLALGLLKAGADPKAKAEVKLGPQTVVYAPLNLAAENGTLEIVTAMVEKGADLNFGAQSAAIGGYDGTWGGDGYTPLVIAIAKGNYDIAHFLVDKGADLSIGSNGFTILKNKKMKLECLASVSKKLPIYYAVEGTDLPLVQKIADKMTWKFNPEYTIQQWGGGGRKEGTVRVSCDFGRRKIAPSDWAKQMGWDEAEAYLEAKGL